MTSHKRPGFTSASNKKKRPCFAQLAGLHTRKTNVSVTISHDCDCQRKATYTIFLLRPSCLFSFRSRLVNAGRTRFMRRRIKRVMVINLFSELFFEAKPPLFLPVGLSPSVVEDWVCFHFEPVLMIVLPPKLLPALCLSTHV